MYVTKSCFCKFLRSPPWYASPCNSYNQAEILKAIWTSMTLVKENALDYEKNIVWLEDINDCPWVRESSTDFLTKHGISKNRQSQIEAGEKN